MCQAHLKPHAAIQLRELIPALTEEDIYEMQRIPIRSFDPLLVEVSVLDID